jgi:hypothetical protein
MLLEKMFKASKAMRDSFCVVQPVNRENDFLVAKAFLDLVMLFDYLG